MENEQVERMNQYAVETVELVKRFGDFTAVDGVTFTVERGEIFGFLGPNGAGKTTTMRMLMGLIEPTAGSATVLGFDVVEQTTEIRRRIGYMSQRFSLYNDLTVDENLTFFGGAYDVRGDRLKARKADILAMAGLEGRERELAKNLSGGWRQRLALGCALVHEPEMLFLDEPTAGVDPISRREFWDLLYNFADQGRTIFVTTHYMDEAEHCGRLSFIQHGRLVALGSPQEIKREKMPGQVLEVDCTRPDVAVQRLREPGVLRWPCMARCYTWWPKMLRSCNRPLKKNWSKLACTFGAWNLSPHHWKTCLLQVRRKALALSCECLARS
jgi:ABC-2 type transport system ATP-binding protein